MELTSGENENLAQLFGDGFLANLRAALTLDWPYSERARKTGGVAAAVLVLIGMREGVPSILITRRTESVETHKGQMAFPGGVSDPEDQADLMRTALRETEEEVGIPRRSVEVWGQLPPLYTVTGFWVTPIVGLLNQPVDQVGVSLNPDEIAEIAWIPLELLRNRDTYRRETIEHGGIYYPIHVYHTGDYRIWGATGAMIKNFLDRLARVENNFRHNNEEIGE